MPIISSFKNIENKYDKYRNKDCMKKFCTSLREHSMKTINFRKKKMKLLTKEQQKSYQNVKTCYICEEKIKDKHAKYKIYRKVRDHWEI